ncbi:MAG: hypothetical protein LBP28_00210 [Coriobacteriales bacterium]|jgi:shikimate dehydrogenase|nr:hypothetical protein [Coriobacteriales bacterium]
MTCSVALFGFPVEHSLSPVMHAAAYAHLGLDWNYQLVPCCEYADFDAGITRLRAGESGLIAANVTTPWKREAFAAAEDCLDDVAKHVGAANVLFSAPGSTRICCANTDGQGAVIALSRQGVSVDASSFVLCGTGAVAKVILLELIRGCAPSVTVLSRNRQRAVQLVESLVFTASPSVQTRIIPLAYGDAAAEVALLAARVIIDATTVGANSFAEPVVSPQLLGAAQIVLDVNYGRGGSALLRGAQARGAQVLDGLEMLIEQAALSIEFWAGQQGLKLSAPRDVMRVAALAECQRRGVSTITPLAL